MCTVHNNDIVDIIYISTGTKSELWIFIDCRKCEATNTMLQ